MPIRSLFRGKTVHGYAEPATAPIYVDSDDSIVKIIPAGSGTTEVELVDTTHTQTISGDKTFTGTIVISGIATVTEFADGSAAAPSITFSDEKTTGIYRIGASNLGISLGGAIEIDISATAFSPGVSNGSALGTTGLKWADLFLADGGVIDFNTEGTLTHSTGNLTVTGINFTVNDDLLLGIGTGNTARLSYDTTDANSNQLLLQLPAAGSVDSPVVIVGQSIESVDFGAAATGADYSAVVDPRIAIFSSGAVTTAPVIEFRKARGTTAAPTVCTSGDDLGTIDFYGAVANGEYVRAASIRADIAGTIATTRGPGTLTFLTATDAAPSVLAAALTLNADHSALFGGTVTVPNSVNATVTAPTVATNGVFGLITASANWGGNLVGVRGRVTSTATGAIASAAGVHAALRLESASGPGSGLTCALNAEVQSETAVFPNAIVYIQSLPHTALASFATVPYVVFSETCTASGVGSNILFEVGHNAAGTVPTLGTGKLYYNNTLQIAVNKSAGVRSAYYIPLSDAEGSFAFGTSGTPITDDTVSKTFVSGYFDNGAASGWSNGAYFSMLATGAGGSYTSLEGDMTVSVSATDLTGVECFMGFTGAGRVSGHAAAGQFTLDFSNAALPAPGGGDYSAGLFNVKGEGGSCSLANARNVACLQLKTEGTFIATPNNFQTMGYAILINGFTAGVVGQVLTNAASTPATVLTNCYGLKVGLNTSIDANYTAYYIPLVPIAQWS